eukprot:TRINITY_DN1084_c0_g2_i3.p1 TRINITY_DN1084_c0_g2~~TRINITY_DN1084_c0_g2_i3.p1  ORF type:complete len:169 (+),score=53.80 TRINITY_DN1084_c0_g2_i3:53-559(+)
MVSSFSALRLANELKALQQGTDQGFSVGLRSESNIYVWDICFEGPSGSLYQGGFYKAELVFPSTYPNEPPVMRFLTEMWHPNIYPDGKVCISILHSPGTDPLNPQELAEERWRPILGVEAITVSVISMLGDPNLSSPANVDAAKQYKEHYEDYKKKVKRLAMKSVEEL